MGKIWLDPHLRRSVITLLVLTASAWLGTTQAATAPTQPGFQQPLPRVIPYSVNYELNPGGLSHLSWPFHNTKTSNDDVPLHWHRATGSSCHNADDEYADDWNYRFEQNGGPTNDEFRSVMSVAHGTVIYSGDTGENPGYGKQIVVRFRDNQSMAVRYAHLHSRAVEVGDYVHVGSMIGTLGRSGGQASPHLHLVVYKNLGPNQIDRLSQGWTPSNPATNCSSGPASQFAAMFEVDGLPVSERNDNDAEDLPCSRWNGNIPGGGQQQCNAHSILFGATATQDCAYYRPGGVPDVDGICAPRGTSNCDAHIGCYDGIPDELEPCHGRNTLQECNEWRHNTQGGNGVTRGCAWYIGSSECRARGTSNCLAVMENYCDDDNPQTWPLWLGNESD